MHGDSDETAILKRARRPTDQEKLMAVFFSCPCRTKRDCRTKLIRAPSIRALDSRSRFGASLEVGLACSFIIVRLAAR